MSDLVLCIVCGRRFRSWQRVTPGPRHGACNPELLEAERQAIFGPAEQREPVSGKAKPV